MAETVKFNVGGQVYQVSRSLLEMYPDSMLATSASDKWQTEAEIFIERDGTRFKFVLDYLRDGRVTLPITESKEMLIAELNYYGLEIDDGKIDEKATYAIKNMETMSEVMSDLKQEASNRKADWEKYDAEHRCVLMAIDIIHGYFEKG